MAPRKPKVVEVVERTSTCKQCRWSEFGKEAVTCRRYPPVPITDLSGRVYNYLPIVSVEDYCGEFSPQLSS
jgi:hypothetical protein